MASDLEELWEQAKRGGTWAAQEAGVRAAKQRILDEMNARNFIGFDGGRVRIYQQASDGTITPYARKSDFLLRYADRRVPRPHGGSDAAGPWWIANPQRRVMVKTPDGWQPRAAGAE